MAGGINKVEKTEPCGIQDDSQIANSQYYSVIGEVREDCRIRKMNRSDGINEFVEVVFSMYNLQWSTRYFVRKQMFCKNDKEGS